jgi:hypothetical protein
VAIATQCNINSPFFESFESSNWSAFTSLGTIDTCWKREALGSYNWGVEASTTSNSAIQFSGAKYDRSTRTGKFMEVTYIGGGPNVAGLSVLETPVVVLNSNTPAKLSYWFHMYGSYIDQLNVYISEDFGQNFVPIDSVLGEQQNSHSAAWKQHEINLNAYQGKKVKIQFVAVQSSVPTTGIGTRNRIGLDDIFIGDTLTCQTPHFLKTIFTTESKAHLSWLSRRSNSWQLSYSTNKFFLPNTGTIVNSSSTQLTLTGLMPDTEYSVYVREQCDSNQFTDWVPGSDFRTQCNPVGTPYFEDFYAFLSLPNPRHSFPTCWRTFESYRYEWDVRTGLASFSGGPSNDHTPGSQAAYGTTISIYSNLSESTSLKTELIDLGASNSPELGFWYHMYGADIDTLKVYVLKDSFRTKVFEQIGQAQFSSNDPWLNAKVLLDDYLNDTIRIEFVGAKKATGGNALISIDDISINEQTICPQPTSISALSNTDTSITISWRNGSLGTASTLVYSRKLASGGAFSIDTAYTSPHTIIGLQPNAEYEIKIQDSCSGIGASNITQTINYYTKCGLAIAPFYEDFNGQFWLPGNGVDNQGDSIRGCWTRPVSAPPHFSVQDSNTNTGFTGPTQDASGMGAYLYSERSAILTQVPGEIISPNIYIPSNFEDATLSYYYHMYGMDIHSLNVAVSANGGPFKVVYTLAGMQQTSEFAAWQKDSVNVSAYRGDTIQVKFLANSLNVYGDIAIDNFELLGSPSACASILDLEFENVNTTSALVKWLKTNLTATNTSLKYYELNAGSSTAVTRLVSGNTYLLSGLNPQTKYVVEVLDSCGSLASVSVKDTFATFPCEPLIVDWTYSILSTTSNGQLTQFDASASQGAERYQWSFGDGGTATGSNPVHNYVYPGLAYEVELTVSNYCGEEEKKKFALNQLSTEEYVFSENFKLYPNPAKNQFSLVYKANELSLKELTIVSLDGKVAKQLAPQSKGYNVIPIRDLDSGLYIVHIVHAKGSEKIKLRVL